MDDVAASQGVARWACEARALATSNYMIVGSTPIARIDWSWVKRITIDDAVGYSTILYEMGIDAIAILIILCKSSFHTEPNARAIVQCEAHGPLRAKLHLSQCPSILCVLPCSAFSPC